MSGNTKFIQFKLSSRKSTQTLGLRYISPSPAAPGETEMAGTCCSNIPPLSALCSPGCLWVSPVSTSSASGAACSVKWGTEQISAKMDWRTSKRFPKINLDYFFIFLYFPWTDCLTSSLWHGIVYLAWCRWTVDTPPGVGQVMSAQCLPGSW